MRTLAGHDARLRPSAPYRRPGRFLEPVTQHTKRFVRAFWVLDKQLANSRHYPAISWMDSYSEYVEDVAEWWMGKTNGEWHTLRTEIIAVMQQEARLQRVVKLVGADVLPDSQRLILETANVFKNAFLQQNAYDKVDAYSGAEKQYRMLQIITTLHKLALEAIRGGAALEEIRQAPVFNEVMQMKYQYDNETANRLTDLLERARETFHGFARDTEE